MTDPGTPARRGRPPSEARNELRQRPRESLTPRGRATALAFQDAARTVIERQGFLATTVADIAGEAGRSPASFYNYFESKEALLEEWAREFREVVRGRALAAPDAELTAREAIEQGVRAFWDTYRDRKAEMIAIQQFTAINTEFAALWREMCADGVTMVARTVRRGDRDGFPPPGRPETVASAVISMLTEFGNVWLAKGGEGVEVMVDDEEAIATLTEIWYRAIYGLDRVDDDPVQAGRRST